MPGKARTAGQVVTCTPSPFPCQRISLVLQHGEVGLTAPSRPFGHRRRTPMSSGGFARLHPACLNSLLQFWVENKIIIIRETSIPYSSGSHLDTQGKEHPE